MPVTGFTHVALLRGINVGGKNALPMKTLSALFEKAGCASVATYIQSGNVLFAAPPDVARRIPADVQRRIKTTCKLSVPVVVRSKKEWGTIVAKNPFLERGADEASLHLICLAGKPTQKQLISLDTHRSPGDEFIAQGANIYLHLPQGVARSKLTNAYFDRALNTISTSRNWRTVLKLHEMLNT